MLSAAVTSLAAHHGNGARAGTVYWDPTGATANTTAPGVWDQNTTLDWSTDPNGTLTLDTYQNEGGPVPDAVFTAGTTATGSSTVTVSGTVEADSITTNNGAITLTGGTIDFGGTSSQLTLGGTGLTIASKVTGTNGLTFTDASTTTRSAGLSAANTGLSGPISIGTNLEITANNASAMGTGSITVASGGGLNVGGGGAQTIGNAVFISGTGEAARGALRLSFSSGATGGVNLNANATITSSTATGGAIPVNTATISSGALNLGTFTATIASVNADNLNITSNVVGTGTISSSNFLLELSGSANTFSGGVTITGNGSGGTTLGSVVQDNNANIGALGSGNVTINTGTGTLDLNGNSPTIGLLAGNNAAAVVTNNSGGGTLSTLTLSGTGSQTYPGLIKTGASSGVALVISSGTQTLSSASSTYSGGTTINGGVLVAGAAGTAGTSGPLGIGTVAVNSTGELRTTTGNGLLGSPTITLAGGTIRGFAAANTTVGGNVTVTADSNLIADRSATGAGVSYTYGTLALGTNILSVSSTTNVSSGTATMAFGATTFSGNPTFNISNNSNSTDSTVLSVGTLSDGGTARTITESGNGNLSLTATGTLSSGTVIDVKSGTLTGSSNNIGTLAILQLGDTSGSNNATINFGGSVVEKNPISVIGGSTGNTLTLAISGNVFIQNSSITLNHDLAIVNNQALQLQVPVTGTGNVAYFARSTFTSSVTTGASLNFNGSFTNATGTTGNSGLTITGTGTIGTNVTALIQNSSNGSLIIANNNPFFGDTTVTQGTLNIQSSQALQNSVLNVNNTAGTVTFGNGTLTTLTTASLGGLAGNGNINLLNNNTTPAAVALTIGNTNVSNGSISNPNTLNPIYSGAIGQTAGSASLTKIGSNNQTLSGTSSYTGNTTINGGTLTVLGDISASPLVTVGGAGTSNSPTLAGTGNVGAVTVNSTGGGAAGTISPGNAGIGSITTGNLTLGGNYAADINAGTNGVTGDTGSSGTPVAGVNDVINVTSSASAVSIDSTNSTLTLTLTNVSDLSVGNTYVLILNGSGNAITTNTGFANIVVAGPVQVTQNPNYNADGGGVGNDFAITITSVPEPGCTVLLATGGIALLNRRRRKMPRAV